MIWLVLIVVGLCLGSFVNALVWRLHAQAATREAAEGRALTKAERAKLRTLSVNHGRSRCLSCGHELAARDLVPVVSWLWLRGRCRYCKARIPDTPLAELTVPLSFVISYIWWPWLLSGLAIVPFIIWLAALVAFVALMLYDLKWYLLPNRIVFPLIGLAVAYRVLLAAQSGAGWLPVLLGGLWGVIVLAGLFYALFVVSNERWIGGGDVKLAIALGLFSGGPLAACLLLFVASLAGTLAAVPMVLRNRSMRAAKVPFGPFLLLATVVTVLWGDHILSWYASLFIG